MRDSSDSLGKITTLGGVQAVFALSPAPSSPQPPQNPVRRSHSPVLRLLDVEVLRSMHMELAIRIEVQQLPEGLYLATSDELPGLVAQGRTVSETLEIARDVARRLIEARREREGNLSLPTTSQRHEYTIVVAS